MIEREEESAALWDKDATSMPGRSPDGISHATRACQYSRRLYIAVVRDGISTRKKGDHDAVYREKGAITPKGSKRAKRKITP